MLSSMSSKRNCLLLTFCVAIVGLLFVSYSLINRSDDWTSYDDDGDGDSTSTSNDCPTPKRNIVFLKTHKTAGSSVQNIFMRYARRHDLLMVLPFRGNYLGHPRPFDAARFVPKLARPELRYNVLAHHARFRSDAMRNLMPDDAAFITILREPVALFESLYAYYSLNATYRMDIAEYATSDRSWIDHHNRRFYKKIGRNQMSFDLGMNRFQFDSAVSVAWTIRQLDRQFDLVMIAELMDESLVLLKDLLCWDIDDVITFKHNVRTKESRVALPPKVMHGIRTWNGADDALYKHFRSRLQDKVAAFGRLRMINEVARLRRRTRDWYNYCVEDTASHGSKVANEYRAHNKQVFSFRLRPDVRNATCNDLAKPELSFTAEMRAKQSRFLQQVSDRTLPVETTTSSDRHVESSSSPMFDD